jgi:hypothetical protein
VLSLGALHAVTADTRYSGDLLDHYRAGWVVGSYSFATLIPKGCRSGVPENIGLLTQRKACAMMCLHLLFPIVALTLLTASVSRAQGLFGNPYETNERIWQQMDKCRLAAQQQHPDWTAEDDKARERATQLCLRSQNLPPVTPLGPSTWPTGPAVSGSTPAK